MSANERASQRTAQIARAWVFLYTLGLPADLREARRNEISSDLWESQHDFAANESRNFAASTFVRVIAGLPADISWSFGERCATQKGRLMERSWYDQSSLQNLIVPAVVAGFVLAGLMTLAGVSTAVAALISGVTVVAIVGIARGFAQPSADTDSRKVDHMDAGIAHSRRTQLMIVLGASVVILIATAAYAFSLDEWGNTRAIMFNVVGFACLVIALVALVMLVADMARSRRA